MKDIAIKSRFVEISSELSPENLHCDGERPAAEAARIGRLLKKEWAKLEAQIGFPVSEQMIYEKFLPEVRRHERDEEARQMAAEPQHPLLKHFSAGRWMRVATNGETAYNIYSTAEGRFEVSFSFVALNAKGDYPTLDEAVECADNVLRGLTPESIRQRFPHWQQFAIDREMARSRVS